MAENIYEHGRRYQGYSKDAYPLPNDDDELSRLDIQHYQLKFGLGDRLYLAPIPIDKHLEVLDLGTGSGIWAKELAQDLPLAKVTGVDLSSVDGEDIPSCNFIIGDYEKDWSAWTSSQFDYIHARMLLAATRDGMALTTRAAQHLRPGGWFEWQELVPKSTCRHPNPAECKHEKLEQWLSGIFEGAASLGIDLGQGAKLGSNFEKAGLVDNQIVVRDMPMGPWKDDPLGKRTGEVFLRNFLAGLEGVSLTMFLKGLGMERQELNVLLDGVREEVLTPGFRHSMEFHIYFGQKAVI